MDNTIPIHRVFKPVLKFFNNDYDKTLEWFTTQNPGLGDISPYDMLELGQHERLYDFITALLNGETP